MYLCLLVCLCGVKMKRACEKGDIREVNRILLKKPQLSPLPTTQTPDHNQQHQQQQQQQQHQQHRQDDVSNEDLNNGLPIKGIWESSRLTFEQSIQFAQIETLDEDYIYICLDYFENVEDPPYNLGIDEACSIRFYTMETPFYKELNCALRKRDRNEAKRFFPSSGYR